MGIIATIERAPTKNGGHTTYCLMLQEDNIVKPFPLLNFTICKQEHKRKIESEIKEKGFQLVLDD